MRGILRGLFPTAIKEVSISILEVMSGFHLGTEAGEGQGIVTGVFIRKEFVIILLQENPGVHHHHHHMDVMTGGLSRM